MCAFEWAGSNERSMGFATAFAGEGYAQAPRVLCSLCICLCETRIRSSVFPWVFTCLILVCRVETKNPYKDLYKLTAVQLGLLMVVLEEILEDDCPRVCMRALS